MADATSSEAKTIHRLVAFKPKTYQFKHNAEHPALFLLCLALLSVGRMDRPEEVRPGLNHRRGPPEACHETQDTEDRPHR